ncbi:MAG TPA: toll/interleukin-1 receptor domain-containing protein [Acetobacteraceae bacterium]|nr:toll/interleukin-1 receptor domain-containing protein [Acetobacteraceae bacterium]
MSHDAFISYSTHDKAVADAACAALEAAGIRCWIAPRDITPGAEWGEAIIDGINHCRVMILIFSASANDSPQIRREVERAVSKGVPIIPLRIQDIAPARSLEYFIGTVHWLDALTPPLESHLRRLGETVKSLLQIDPLPPRIVAPADAAAASSRPPSRRLPVMIVLALLVSGAAGGGIWWLVARRPPSLTRVVSEPAPVRPPVPAASPAAPAPSPAPTASRVAPAPSPPRAAALVDPALVGTFEFATVIDGYDWRYVDSITANGTYSLVTTQEEDGTYAGANGAYRTVGAKTGQVRTGTYHAVGSDAIAVTSASGTAIFRPVDPTAPLDPANPVMLGVWQATIVQSGMTWTLTIQNNPNGTFHYEARAEDHGVCAFADQVWRATSAVTRQTTTGTYRVIDARNVELTSAAGSAVWHRQ